MAKRQSIVGIFLLFIGLFSFSQEGKQNIFKVDELSETDSLVYSNGINQIPIILYHDLKTESGLPDFMTVLVKYSPTSIMDQIQIKEGKEPLSKLIGNSFTIPASPDNYKQLYIAYIGESEKPSFPKDSKITFQHQCCPKRNVVFWLNSRLDSTNLRVLPTRSLDPEKKSCSSRIIEFRDKNGKFFSGELNLGKIRLEEPKELLLFNISGKKVDACEVAIKIASDHIGLKNRNKRITLLESSQPVFGQILPPTNSEGSKRQRISAQDTVSIYMEGKEIKKFIITYTLNKPIPIEKIILGMLIIIVLGLLIFLLGKKYFSFLIPKGDKTKKTFADRFLLDLIRENYESQSNREIQEIVEWALQSVSSGAGANPGQQYSQFLAEVGFSKEEAEGYRRRVKDNLKYISDEILDEDKALLSSYAGKSEKIMKVS